MSDRRPRGRARGTDAADAGRGPAAQAAGGGRRPQGRGHPCKAHGTKEDASAPAKRPLSTLTTCLQSPWNQRGCLRQSAPRQPRPAGRVRRQHPAPSTICNARLPCTPRPTGRRQWPRRQGPRRRAAVHGGTACRARSRPGRGARGGMRAPPLPSGRPWRTAGRARDGPRRPRNRQARLPLADAFEPKKIPIAEMRSAGAAICVRLGVRGSRRPGRLRASSAQCARRQ